MHDKMTNKQETISSPAMQKFSDLEERVHYLEDQNLTVRKALETALNQNKYLEDRLENLGKNLPFEELFFSTLLLPYHRYACGRD